MIRKALFLFTLLFVVGVSTEARVRVKLTKAMYNSQECELSLCDVFAVNIYGDSKVHPDHYADLADYEALVVEVAEGTPRFLFNVVRDGDPLNGTITSLIEMPKSEAQTAAYQTIEDLEDGKKAYIIDLKQIKKDEGKVHLNCIKSAGYMTNIGVIVTRMYLLKPIPAENTSYDATVLKDNEIILTPRYRISDTYLNANELSSATDGFAIVNDNRVLCVDDDVPHIETREKTRVVANVTGFDGIPTTSNVSAYKSTYEDKTYKNELALSWRFMREEGDTFDESQYSANYKFHHFDAYSDKFSELGYACASPYTHLWMTMEKDEKEERNYYEGKENCLYGPNWLIESVGNGELKSVAELQSGSFYMLSGNEQTMSYFNTSSDNIQVGNVADALKDVSAYRNFAIKHEYGDGADAQYRIEVLNVGGEKKTSNEGTYLNVGFRSEAFVGPSLSRGVNPEDLVKNETKVTFQKLMQVDGVWNEYFLYVKEAQNCSMGVLSYASAEGNGVKYFVLEKAVGVENGYLFRAKRPNGTDYSYNNISPVYLNVAPWGITFVLGLNGQNGQDMENGAVWKFENGGIRNVATGKYLNGASTSDTPEACSLRRVEVDFKQWDLKPEGGAELDWGSLWQISYVEGQGFAFRNNSWKNGRSCYLNTDGSTSESPVYFQCYDPAKFLYSEGKAIESYALRNVGVMQGNFNVDYKGNDADGKEIWEHDYEYNGLGYLKHLGDDYLHDYVVDDADGSILRTREGWRANLNDATKWRFKKIERVPESVSEDRLIDDLVFALRHMRANEFNRYQCYDDNGQPTLTPVFEACWKEAHEYLYEQGQAYNGNVERLAERLEYYNARLHLVKPKPGDFIRMQGEKNETYFSGSSSSTVYPMVSSPSASTIFYYDGSKLVNYSTGLVFANSETDFNIGTQLMEEGDKIAETTLFADSRATRFADQRKQNPVRHTYSVYMGKTDTDKVLIAKDGKVNNDGNYMGSAPYAHATIMSYPEPGSEYGGQYDPETEILLTKIIELPITVKASGYSTFYCPQDVDLITEGAKAYMGKVNDEMSQVSFISMPENGTRIPAKTPVLIELKGGGEVKAKVRTTGSAYATASGAAQNCLIGKYYTTSYLKGEDKLTYAGYKVEKEDIESHVYSLSNGTWKFYTGNTIPAFKACLRLEDIDEEKNQIKTFTFTFDDVEVDDETSIQIAEAFGTKVGDDVMYNLSGQRVISPRKGVYVVNGKKVMVK